MVDATEAFSDVWTDLTVKNKIGDASMPYTAVHKTIFKYNESQVGFWHIHRGSCLINIVAVCNGLNESLFLGRLRSSRRLTFFQMVNMNATHGGGNPVCKFCT